MRATREQPHEEAFRQVLAHRTMLKAYIQAIVTQRSSPLTLVAGWRYYIEVRRKTDAGLDHLAVAWQPPGGRREIIRGEFLSPPEPEK